jgi:superfamily II DNA or RNA helicase
MNKYKKSSGSKFQWRPAKPPTIKNAQETKPTSSESSTSQQIKHQTQKTLELSSQPPPPLQKTLNTYLGPKGYTIPKQELTDAQIANLRKTLTVKPVTGGNAFGAADTVEFPIYRESSNKIYLPRFYGKSIFGEVKRTTIHPGDDINIEFAGSLRPIQVPVVEAYVNSVTTQTTEGQDFGGGGLLELPCAFGKTVLSLNIIARLKKKTLVIVNKEFLLNQWIERISQFLPDAKVGRIQGPEIDIDGKDIVLGMLQSISMKDYDPKVFESFGLTIIDEVHHISSEVFSRALFKIVSKYMLGLSATMERKDGTTYVFKQFLGEVVFKGERDEGEHDVEVRAIEYVSKDAEFNKVECDFRGNPKYSTMIVKLCDHSDRSDFIVRVIRDLIKEQPGAQIMILAHNRSILTYLHDSINAQGIATAGYYVGGMKESALKETEEKQVVVATYAMAAEALDIKTLNTLVMVTPKTDIVQSVGRILREKHEKPLVVDIVDGHDVFKNQWAKRRRYYKKCEYTIRSINSVKYGGFLGEEMEKWKLVYRSAANHKKTAKCVVQIEDSSGEEYGTDTNSEDENKTEKKPSGPKKCMVVLDSDIPGI